MAFPSTILDFQAELNLGGTWTSITSPNKVYQRNGPVTISRGKPDEATTLNPAIANVELNNRDGRFAPRNPTGPYYGNLVRNTPMRLSVPAQSNYLRLEADNSSYASTPDSVALSITGDTEIQLDMNLSSYKFSALCNKSSGTPQASWLLELNGDGTLVFFWSADGTNLNSVTSTASIPVGRTAIKVTLAVATGTVTFYTAPTIAGSWTQLGTASSGTGGAATSVFDSTSPVVVGDNANSANGQMFGFKLISGIGGTVKAYADFTSQTAGVSSFTDAQSNVWTLHGTAEISSRHYRFHGEVSSFPQKWDVSGNDVWTPVQASGITRRLQQGKPAADSAMKRYLRLLSGSSVPLAYWPCEDGSSSTQIGATIGPAMAVTGSPSLAANSSFLCSSAIPTLNGSTWQANVPQASSAPTTNSFKFLLSIPSGGDTNNAVIARMYTTGTTAQFDLVYGTGSSGSFEIIGYDNSGSQQFSPILAAGINGRNLMVELRLTQNGSNTTYAITWLDQSLPGVTNGTTGTVTTATIGQVSRIVINPDGAATNSGVGHIMVGTANDLTSYINPFDAYAGETAAARLARICTEEGIAYRIYGYPNATQGMGAQTPNTVMQLIQQVEDTDRGMLYEPRQVLGIGYRTRQSIENQSAAVTLSYAAADLGDGSSTSLEPTDDDQFTRNDVTITRNNGSSSRQTVSSGTLSTQAPPNGVGTYDYNATMSLYIDHQAGNLAGWISHVGTTDEPRYPVIPVNLARAELSGNAVKYYGLQVIDQGDFLDITVPVSVSWLPPGDIRQVISGTREKLGGFVFSIEYNCVPEKPYEIGVIGSGATTDARVDTDGSTLSASATSGATSISVATTTPTANSINLWTTTAGDFPFDIMVGGEQMTVTNITGSSSPQTFTVTRAVNGIVKAHSSGEAVNVYDYAIVAIDDPY